MPFLFVFAISFTLSLLLTPLAAKLGLRFNLADQPGGRRKHAGRIARTGGIAIFVSFVAGILITPLLDLPRTDPNEFIRMGGLLIGLFIVFGFGLLDDRFDFRPGLQFVVQAIASLVAIASLIIIERFNNPFTNQEVNLSEIAPWLIVPSCSG
jgi:UDP-GlcNAc:undecaprenyl-phosphate GlcNAc-1-phosphate transferase